MSDKIKLSLLIPAYNEEKIIENTLEKVLKFLSKKKYSWEVIVIDDGSSDQTSLKAKKFNKEKVLVVRYEINRGKGGALKEGVYKSRGDYIIFSDADLSVDIGKVDEVLNALKKSDVVIGSRRIQGAKILVHQPILREFMGRGYTHLTKLVTGVKLADFTCGFKGFKKNAAKYIFKKTLINRWAYDSEILFLAKKFKYKLTEIPVEWKNREDTRVVLKTVIIESLKDLLSISVNDFLGKYN